MRGKIVLLLAILSCLFILPSEMSLQAAAWYGAGGWKYRQGITIRAGKVSPVDGVDLVSFPLLINNTNSDWRHTAQGGHMGNIDASDLRLTASDGSTDLKFEIENYDPTSGELTVWVKTDLDADVDTVIYMYYGNAGAADGQSPDEVWDDDYQNVYHLNASANDSSTPARHGTDVGTANIAGKFGAARDFGGGNSDYIRCDAVDTDLITISTWVYWDSVGGHNPNDAFFQFQNGGLTPSSGGTDKCVAGWVVDGGDLAWGRIVDVAAHNLPMDGSAPILTEDRWTYFTYVADGTNYQVYMNGDPYSLIGYNGNIKTFDRCFIGKQGSETINGRMDEFRVSNIVRSKDWIKTSYNNQSSPETFYTMTPEEVEVVGWYDSAWNCRRKITVQSGQVATSDGSDLFGFPVMISVTDNDFRTVANGGKVWQADADEFLFTSTDGTSKLPHEIEAYDPVNGKIVAWVRLPMLSASADTDIYLYYLNEIAANQQDANSVWSTGFDMVMHMKEDPTGGAPQMKDSTGNGFDGTTQGAMIAG
ncbi:DUF2341 domain-containing protein, partial [Planctomycetota bacterium]